MNLDLPFEDWLPDQVTTSNPGMIRARNVIPSQIGYRPLPSLQQLSDALTEEALGALTLKDNDNNVFTFAGTASTLQRLIGQTWSDVSKTGGYSTTSEEHWAFEIYGTRVIATNYDDPMQTFDVNTDSAFSDLTADAPNARRLAVINEFLFAGDLNTSVDGVVRNRVRWSAIGDPTDWPDPGTQDAQEKQSDFQDLPIGGPVSAIARATGGSDGLILCQRAIYRVTYQGPPTVFGFFPIEENRGCIAPKSAVTVSGITYFLAEDGFYACNGQSIEPIGEGKVDRTFYNGANRSRLQEMTGVADPFNRIIIWLYAGDGNDTSPPDRAIIYHWPTQRWTEGRFSARLLFEDFVQGYTLDQLDMVSSSLDDLEFSLDSRSWTGGRLVVSAIGPQDRLARLEGLPLEATLITREQDGDGSDGRLYINGALPVVTQATPFVRLIYRQNTWSDTLIQSPERQPGVNRIVPFRVNARYVRAQVRIPAGEDWLHATGVRLDAKQAGRR